MHILESKRIIESLANGIDPETGEHLSDESPMNSPQVIRALFIAVNALEHVAKREKREGSLPANAGKSWSQEEDNALIAEFDSGHKINEIAGKLARTEGAIAARLVRLGRIHDRSEVYTNE